MRSIIALFVVAALGACGSGGSSTGNSCPLYASAGGNRFSDPAYDWSQVMCACAMPLADGGTGGSSCSTPNSCAPTCCTCPGSTWTFKAQVCKSSACLDPAAACAAVLAATGEPCKNAPQS